MWKDYSRDYLKHNRAASFSVIAASLAASLFLSLLLHLAFQFWNYEINLITEEEGGWHARITGAEEDDIALLRSFSNVKETEITVSSKDEEEDETQGLTVNLYFENPKTVFQDMPLIAEQLGLSEENIEYHHLLLSRLLIHDPADPNPPLLLPFLTCVLILICLALLLIIYNSFALSMNTRIRQFGILSCTGATPGQICLCLLQEAAALCILPVLLGNLLGILGAQGIVYAINTIGASIPGRVPSVWTMKPSVSFVSIFASTTTVFFSALIPAVRLSRISPLEAVRQTEAAPHSSRKPSLIARLFGIEGELAETALRTRRKALRTSALSLTLSFTTLGVMLCFFTLSRISTEETYFARYQDAWDVMVSVKDTEISDFSRTDELKNLPGIRDCAVYQKGKASVLLPEDMQSPELLSLGGLSALSTKAKTDAADGVLMILDDESFLSYCRQTGTNASLDGAILLNQIWDSLHSNFRSRSYLPFVNEELSSVTLESENGQELSLPLLSLSSQPPLLREEYPDYSLVLFLPVSLWNSLTSENSAVFSMENDMLVRVLAEENPSLAELAETEKALLSVLSGEAEAVTENRIQEKILNDKMIRGYLLLVGGFCTLLAAVGIANIFSNTLSFLRLRKREFARYMSIGMEPRQMKKMFLIEALFLAGRPLLFALPFTAAFAVFAVSASHLEIGRFLKALPAAPFVSFSVAVLAFVFLAYYLGGRSILRCDLTESLRNDSL